MQTARPDYTPRKLITVINRLGDTVVRADGIMLDGDTVRKSFMFQDSEAVTGTVHSTDAEIQATGAHILGEDWDVAHFAGLTGDAARHAIVRRKLGAVADNRPVQFLDAAWQALAKTLVTSPASAAETPDIASVRLDAARVVADVAYQELCDRIGNSWLQNAVAGEASPNEEHAYEAYCRRLSNAYSRGRQ